MIRYNARSKSTEFVDMVAARHPEIYSVLNEAGRRVPDRKQSIRRYQAALLYLFAAQYDDQTIVDLGTRVGYSACILRMAAPTARIFTVDTNAQALEVAERNLADFDNIQYVHMPSWDFAEKANDGKIGLVFVDADHTKIDRDLIWWPKIMQGGLMLFHDYTPSKFPVVAEVVDGLADVQHEGAGPDIVCMGMRGEGLAGIYKT